MKYIKYVPARFLYSDIKKKTRRGDGKLQFDDCAMQSYIFIVLIIHFTIDARVQCAFICLLTDFSFLICTLLISYFFQERVQIFALSSTAYGQWVRHFELNIITLSCVCMQWWTYKHIKWCGGKHDFIDPRQHFRSRFFDNIRKKKTCVDEVH